MTGYSDSQLEGLQLRWGKGFLSPGGAGELAVMLAGVDLGGKHVLDFGCGLGGYSRLLAGRYGAAHVTGVDIDCKLVDRATDMAAQAGDQDRMEFIHCDDGLTRFSDQVFDVVFSKETLVRIADKAAVVGEMFRLLKPGGQVLLGDWFCAAGVLSRDMRQWIDLQDYAMISMQAMCRLLADCGFEITACVDRNNWFADYARREHARISGELYEVFLDRLGEKKTKRRIADAALRARLAEAGQFRPGHVRAVKP